MPSHPKCVCFGAKRTMTLWKASRVDVWYLGLSCFMSFTRRLLVRYSTVRSQAMVPEMTTSKNNENTIQQDGKFNILSIHYFGRNLISNFSYFA